MVVIRWIRLSITDIQDVRVGSPPDERQPLPAGLDLIVLRTKRILNRTLDFESPKLGVDR
jgi:hypothetical protein